MIVDWDAPAMRRALARQDISTVYRLVRDAGVSQRRIADLVGQRPSEVCEILSGREVHSYRLLARIADGLGIPRTYLGLADVPQYRGEEVDEEDEAVKRRQFLANAAAIIVGEAVLGDPAACAAPSTDIAVPGRVGVAEVQRLRATTVALRQLDHRHGGGAARFAAEAQVSVSEALLRASMTDEIRKDLHGAVADLHNAVGLMSFDCLMPDQARHHFLRALEHAKQAEDPAHCAFLLCRVGHIYMGNDAPDEALKLFQLAELPAAESGVNAINFVTSCYQARAYSEMGQAERALSLTGRSEDSYVDTIADDVPEWLGYFRAGGADTVRGNVCFALSNTMPEYAPMALEGMRAAVNAHKAGLERGNLMDLGTLATLHLRSGNVDHGLRLAATTVDRAERVDSKRLNQWLRVLGTEARRHGSDGRDLAVAISRL
ncbi:helix-turn-helix domain-containing protein [Lentzea nigeriaca]|uniref:helix-turn-helix domain-containing protein n=1 Tax=Lentzea nigeriaca TaxID=1128665 RepID=UPI00195DE297|nr:helix-turn-helix transcriptional regulator [Lentzea nigeriaca]MBM7857832.1 transcriptional regulator with XRE-family HTH domain [Lentzea nigeriaca]